MSRTDSARARARRELGLWSAWAALVTGTVAAATWAFHILLDVPLELVPWSYAGFVAFPVAGAALLTTRIRRAAAGVFSASVVFCGLVLMVLAVYLVVVVGLGDDVRGTEHRVLALSLVAGLVAVLLAVPTRARLRELASDWAGPRRRPVRAVLETFGTRMTRAVPMDELLLQLTEMLRATIGPAGAQIWTGADGVLERAVAVPEQPRAKITLTGPELAAVASARVSGNAWAEVWLPSLAPGGQSVRVAPVTHAGKLLGLIMVARPDDVPRFGDDDDRVLAELARQVGLALHNVSLDTALQASLEELRARNVELQASRARIVVAADASRREIERNLHDGAQQHLVAMAVKVGLLSRLAADDPDSVQPMLAELRSEIQATVDELRELAHGIYPPLLRNHGLGEALRAAAGRSALPTALAIDTDGRFEAGVEAAVYFCCLEAMQNAGKHAGEGAALDIRICRDGDVLRFSVRDDGAGFDPCVLADGHGFINMRDRVGALGGSIAVESSPGAGAVVRGEIPIAS